MEDKTERKSNGICKVEDHQTLKPCIIIEEQPAATSNRFRYECEGRQSGKMHGKNHTDTNPTYPIIQIHGYTGNGKIKIWASCVTVKPPYRAHPYHLIGDKCKDGIFECYVEPENMRVTLANVGICCIKRKQMEVSLRLREEQGVDPFGNGFDIKKISPNDLNSVRLCFQGVIEGDNSIRLNPVVSDPIYDKKSRPYPSIVRLSHFSAPAVGGVPIVILCTKVVKGDIEVLFFEHSSNWYIAGNVIQVHNQTAIVVETPPFRDPNIEEAVDMLIRLYRISDNALSNAIPFRLTPTLASDTRPRKRRKMEKKQHLQTLNESSTPSNLPHSWYQFDCYSNSQIAMALQQQNHGIISDDSSDIENDIYTGDLIDSQVGNLSDYVESMSCISTTDHDLSKI